MTAVLTMITLQALLGAFDNLWHHEWQARLPQRLGARRELALHALREALYALLFLGLAWWQWQGWALLPLLVLLLAEVVVTMLDFLEEDRRRALPPFERVLHTVLALGYGITLGLFAPVALQWWQLPSGWVRVDHGVGSWLLTLFAAGVALWSGRNLRAVKALQHQADASPAAARFAAGPAVLVTGGTGFIGAPLVRQWVHEGRRVIVLTRDARAARALLGPVPWLVERLADIPAETEIDAVVHLAGATVLGAPWTAGRRRVLLASRIDTMNALLVLMRRLRCPPRVLVSASAVGYYGVPARDVTLDESAPPQPGRFQSDLCVAIEQAAQRAEPLGVRVVRLRLGIVLGRGGGAFSPLVLAARCGVGAVLAGGAQPMPWIHHDDALGLIGHTLQDERLSGPVNAVAPERTTQAGFTRALAAALGRPQWLRVPGGPLKLALGEMAELLLEGQSVVPKAALDAGYDFRFATLAQALAALVAPTRR